MRVIFNLIWWVLFILGIYAIAVTADDIYTFATEAEAQQYMDENGLDLPILENQPLWDEDEDFKPYKIAVPSETTIDELGTIFIIANIVFFIQMIRFGWLILLLVFKFSNFLTRQEPEISPQAVVIVFWW